MRLKIDLHVHTMYSPDSLITPKELVFYARKQGLDGVAVTDHDRIDGALQISKKAEIMIVSGTEITSQEGHIVALGLQETIPRDLSAEETVEKIHEAGGIAVACHPAGLFKESLGNRTNSKFDAIEVINSSAFPFGYSVKLNERIASRLNKPRVAGTDAHYGPEIGCAYTIVEAEPTAYDVIRAIKTDSCRPFGKAVPFFIRLKREFLVLSRRARLDNVEATEIGQKSHGMEPNQMPGRPCTRI